MKELFLWLDKKFSHPLVPLFFLLGCTLLFIGFTSGYKDIQVASEKYLRYISIALGFVCLGVSVFLYYKPPKFPTKDYPPPYTSIFDIRRSPPAKTIGDSKKGVMQNNTKLSSLTSKEKRILRALIDEPHGRMIANYVRYYNEELDALINAGMIIKLTDGRYKLSDSGLEAALSSLSAYFRSMYKSDA
jgi:hypothetical protein